MGSNKEAAMSPRDRNRKEKRKKRQLFDGESKKVEEENKSSKTAGKKKKKREKENNVNVDRTVQISIEGEEDSNSVQPIRENKRDKSLRKKKGNSKERNIGKPDQLVTEVEDGFQEKNDDGAADQNQYEIAGKIGNSEGPREGNTGTEIQTRKSKKGGRNKRKDSMKKGKKLEKKEEAELDEVYHISSGDEDYSKGMKKWVTEYDHSRPGLKILQQRIDEFIIAHEAQLEQERKEREARAAEGGWTVVVHHKGRKKTTDSESGITVGSVSQTVVEDNMAKKKHKEVGPDFYRFQRREAQRNEILMLQSKFEQDRKKIQQLRAARKFRPY